MGSPKIIKRNESLDLGVSLKLGLIFFLFTQLDSQLLCLQENKAPAGAPVSCLSGRKDNNMEQWKRKRDKQFILRTTDDEAALIRRKISAANLKTFQAFALKMLLQGEVVMVDYSELLLLRKEVNAIGQNINQIARFANTLGEIDKQLLIALQEEVKELSHVVTQEFDNRKVEKTHGCHKSFTN